VDRFVRSPCRGKPDLQLAPDLVLKMGCGRTTSPAQKDINKDDVGHEGEILEA